MVHHEGSKTILVIDDEHPVREMIRSLLEIEGYRVLTASNGEQGLELVKKVIRPCLILLDMVMPRVDGHTFIEALRGDPATASIPVVMISASDAVQQHPEIDGQMAKPFQLETLLNVVNKHCA